MTSQRMCGHYLMPSQIRRVKGIFRFSYTGITKIPKGVSGVYAFWRRDNGRCLYVGKAEDQPIRERILQHWRGSHNEKLNLWMREFGNHLDVCYMYVKSNRIARFETRLIRMWNPEANDRIN